MLGRHHRALFGILSALAMVCAIGLAAGDAIGGSCFYTLSEHGDVSTASKAQRTLDLLIGKVKTAGGGTIIVDNKVCKEFIPKNCYQDNPELDAYIHPNGAEGYTGSYKDAPTATIVDVRNGYWNLYVPQYGGRPQAGNLGNAYGGLGIERTLNMPNGMAPTGGFSIVDMQSNIVKGSVNFFARTLDDVQAGSDVRMYFKNIGGLWEGAKLFCYVYGDNGREVVTVKKILWDGERKCNYILADLKNPYPKGTAFGNKTHMPGFSLTVNDNADNQTAGHISVWNTKNGIGDDFLYSGFLSYSSDIANAPGDEGGVVYDAQVQNNLERFQATVKSVDWKEGALYFVPGPERTGCHNLGTSRPLVNLNEKKWITAGTVVIVGCDRVMQDPINAIKDVYKGKRYPSVDSFESIARGGLIEASEDAPWDESVIGRYFALDDPSECVEKSDFFNGFHWGPKLTRRWYRIEKFTLNPDKTKTIRIRRVVRGFDPSGCPMLLNPDNYTWDGHVKPLKYVIAPGAEVSDIAGGWQNLRNNYIKTSHNIPASSPYDNVKVMPNGDSGTKFDFEQGDRVEQAVGPEPWIPRPIRIRMFNHMPSDYWNGAIEVYSHSTVANTFGINFIGNNSPEAIKKRKDHRPDYLNGILFSYGSVGAGVRFQGYVRDAAMLMDQANNNRQPIVWKWNGGKKLTSVVADPITGNLEISGGSLSVGGSGVVNASGISATERKACNMRGINAPVLKDAKRLEVAFPVPEPDGNYSLTAQANWLTMDCVREKTAKGFVIEFSVPAPAQGGAVDWQLIR